MKKIITEKIMKKTQNIYLCVHVFCTPIISTQLSPLKCANVAIVCIVLAVKFWLIDTLKQSEQFDVRNSVLSSEIKHNSAVACHSQLSLWLCWPLDRLWQVSNRCTPGIYSVVIIPEKQPHWQIPLTFSEIREYISIIDMRHHRLQLPSPAKPAPFPRSHSPSTTRPCLHSTIVWSRDRFVAKVVVK